MDRVSVFDQSTFFKECHAQAGVWEVELAQTRAVFKENPVIVGSKGQDLDPM